MVKWREVINFIVDEKSQLSYKAEVMGMYCEEVIFLHFLIGLGGYKYKDDS